MKTLRSPVKSSPYSSPAFTIVELLIVIVIIAILAAIATVSFNAIQIRAKNTQRTVATSEWLKLITAYTSVYSRYPSWPAYTCLGENYDTNWDANPDQDCGIYYAIRHPDATWLTELKKISSSLPTFPSEKLIYNTSGNYFGGITVTNMGTLNPLTDNIPSYPVMTYWLYGKNTDCVLRPIVRNGDGAIVTVPDATYSYVYGEYTECRIALRNPGAL